MISTNNNSNRQGSVDERVVENENKDDNVGVMWPWQRKHKILHTEYETKE